MSAHLTHEELTDNLLGVSSLTVNAHLLSCPACAGELDKLKNSIAAFRGAAHAWSESALLADRTVSVVPVLPRRSWLTANWVLAAVAMILFAFGLTFYLRDHQTRSQTNLAQVAAPVIADPQSQIEKDNELMAQVNSEIGEAVPAPMQPLQISQSVTSTTSATK